jgi:hypothetical protein
VLTEHALNERKTKGVATIAYITCEKKNNILKLLSSENISANKVALGMAMLLSLGSGDLNNLKQKRISRLLSDQDLLDLTWRSNMLRIVRSSERI